ncbi:hypothetical protein ES702_02470 [subsurface metagenome]
MKPEMQPDLKSQYNQDGKQRMKIRLQFHCAVSARWELNCPKNGNFTALSHMVLYAGCMSINIKISITITIMIKRESIYGSLYASYSRRNKRFKQSLSDRIVGIHSLASHSMFNIQHSISNIQYPISNIQYPISNIQYPISNIQYPISNVHPIPGPWYLRYE